MNYKKTVKLCITIILKIQSLVQKEKCDVIDEDLLKALKNYKNIENINAAYIIEFFKSIENSNLKNFDLSAFNQEILSIDSFLNNLKENILIFMKSFDIKLIPALNETLLEKVENQTSLKRQEIIGCSALCPICSAKCILPQDGHKHHYSNHHLLVAFGGYSRVETREPGLFTCSDPKCYDLYKWIGTDRGEKDFITHIKMISDGSWDRRFPDSKDNSALDETGMKIAWLGVKDILLEIFNMKDDTPIKWESLLPHNLRLKKNDISDESKFYIWKVLMTKRNKDK